MLPQRKLAVPAARLWLMATLALAGSIALSAGSASVRLINVSSQGNAVLIEASDPVAYSVSRPDPLTVVVEMRNVSAADASTAVVRRDPISDVAVEQATAIDGKALARVRVKLARLAEHRVRSARGTIRLELTPVSDAPARPAGLPLPVEAARGTGAAAATALQAVHATTRGARTVITLEGNGRLTPSEVTEIDQDPRRLVIDFAGVAAGAPARTAVESALVTGVRVAQNSRDPLLTRVVMEMAAAATYFVERAGPEGRDLAVVFEGPAAMAARVEPIEPALGPRQDPQSAPPAAVPTSAPIAALNGPSRQDPAPPPVQAAPAPVEAAPAQPPATQPPANQTNQRPAAPPPSLAGGTQEGRRYTGDPISLDFAGVDLRAILRVFADHSGLNIIIDPSVPSTPVDILLRDLPWDQAMEVVLRSYQLGYEAEGTIIRIAPLKVLEDEQRQRSTLAAAKALAGDIEVRTFSLSYATAADMAGLLTKSALSSRGQMQVDTRTNTLIISDLPDSLQTAQNLINTLDKPEPQVEVEARVVQTTRDFAQAIGVQWGLNGRVAPELGNTTGLAFPNNGTLAAGVNHPENAASSVIQLAMGAINGAFDLDVALSALERTGKGRVLSTPRLTTQNNIEAEVAQGIQIPIQTVANNTVTVTFRDAVLTLRVTPQITSANTVIMKVQLENATPDFSREVNGIPPIDTQRANTQVQVNDGATTVIGGIFVSREQISQQRTPLLHRIPLLGWMFKRDSQQDESRELLIFITPRILKG
jgi:type IV pilus assembly protein PilQ